MRIIEPNGVYTFEEVQELLTCCGNTIKKFNRNGLKMKKDGNKLYFLGKNIIDFLDNKTVVEEVELSPGEKSVIEFKRRYGKGV